MLEFNNVQLAEGPWPKKAYWDALGHARERDASYYLDYGSTRPRVISQGPVNQGGSDVPFEQLGPDAPFGSLEQILTPTPAVGPEGMPLGEPMDFNQMDLDQMDLDLMDLDPPSATGSILEGPSLGLRDEQPARLQRPTGGNNRGTGPVQPADHMRPIEMR